MDEYTPKYFDVAQLKFLCSKLFSECELLLNENVNFSVNDPTATEALQLNDFIEHIANVAINFRIKYSSETEITAAIDKFLDHSSMLLGNYGITANEIAEWKQTSEALFLLFEHQTKKIKYE